VPTTLDLVASTDGNSLTLDASYVAASRGYRLLHTSSAPETATPLLPSAAGVSLSAILDGSSGDATDLAVLSTADQGDLTRVTADLSALGGNAGQSLSITLNDGWGNIGTVAVTLP